MRFLRVVLALSSFAFALPAHAQLLDLSSTGALQLIEPEPAVEETVAPADEPALPVEWIDIAKAIDAFRIPEKLADLRAVAVDAAGQNYGFYFASASKGTYGVYRNGRRMQRGSTETVADFQRPAVFRMTGSGDLLYALHGTDLYVNTAAVSLDLFSFSVGAGSVHDEGGVLTFPEGGQVVTYDIHRNERKVLYKHVGAIQYLRRSGDTIAYTISERGILRIYRDGRRVSTKPVVNPWNFAVSKEGDVYFFTTAARGYALYRNSRPYITGPGNGAYIDIDPLGHVWHMSYTVANGVRTVRLRKDRSPQNLLPADVANVELSLAFPDGGYALRGSFADQPTFFYAIRDGETVGQPFLFEYPHNDMNGIADLNGSLILRAFDDGRWRIMRDGEQVNHASLKTAWFYRVHDGRLTVYASK